MLIFIGPRRQTDRIRAARKLGIFPRMETWTYSKLYRTRRIPAATYIFLTIDRMDMFEKRIAGKFYAHINSLGPGWRALNNPQMGIGRRPLLRRLKQEGINDFEGYLAVENIAPRMFPVFVRRHAMSVKPLTDLIHTQAELDATLDKLIAEGEPPEDLLITEMRPEMLHGNIYVHRQVHRIAETYFISYLTYDTHWLNQAGKPNLPGIGLAEHQAEHEFMRSTEYLPTIRKAFELAHIEYGRADFAIVDGRPQFYEINFNPWMGLSDDKRADDHPLRLENRHYSDKQRIAALHAIDSNAKGSAPTIEDKDLVRFRLMPWRNYAPERY